MKVICNNSSCGFAKLHKVFEVNSIKDNCPSCGLNSLLPEIATKYKSPKEHHANESISKTKEKLKSLPSLKSKTVKKSNSVSSSIEGSSQTKKSLESIELSYKDKLQKLSKAIKNDKAMKKFSKIDDDILSSSVTLKELNKELKKIDELFGDFKSSPSKKLSLQSTKKIEKKN